MKILLLLVLILPLVNVFSQSKDSRGQKFDKHYYIRKDVFESMPDTEAEILFVGNSITEGGEWS
ncbi:MAG: hypothetical protein R3250_18190, partial [Melioribacteraceae bacterium]|nr:hypothetical protein [Melioribacteraceae bacterium]